MRISLNMRMPAVRTRKPQKKNVMFVPLSISTMLAGNKIVATHLHTVSAFDRAAGIVSNK
jgi:hypothetical protein